MAAAGSWHVPASTGVVDGNVELTDGPYATAIAAMGLFVSAVPASTGVVDGNNADHAEEVRHDAREKITQV